uniref:Uncharacterized protein n=1 Tax=Arundo donax TaxID=35708 RepID=A0A0A9FEM3_ARUDO
MNGIMHWKFHWTCKESILQMPSAGWPKRQVKLLQHLMRSERQIAICAH